MQNLFFTLNAITSGNCQIKQRERLGPDLRYEKAFRFLTLCNFLIHFLSIYDDLMSHHVPSPPGYDVVMTEQVSGPKEPKILGRHMPSVP